MAIGQILRQKSMHVTVKYRTAIGSDILLL